jgi:uncharacterized protein YkvS
MSKKQELKEKERVKPVIVDETYIGSYIDSELGGKRVSNKSYEKYYGKMIKPAWTSKT